MVTRATDNVGGQNGRSPSTTLVWKLAKISRPPEGQKDSGAKRHRWYHRPRLDWHTPVRCRLTLTGGAYPRIRVEARGSVAYIAGDVVLIDVLAAILNQQEPPRG